VLRWLPPVEDGRLRAALRPDIVELASLRHWGLALPQAFGADPASGRSFLLRRWVPGTDILAAARARRPRAILPWLVSASAAIEVLHRFGLAHGNVKAANFIVEEGAVSGRRRPSGRVVLCDPAWRREEESRDSTAGPAAPEAPEAPNGDLSPAAADLFALGELFYLLLTGRPLETEASGFPAPPRRWNPSIPLDLERTVLKLLNPDATRRYQRAGDLLEDLGRLAGSRAAESAAAPECFVGREREVERCLATLGSRERRRAVAVTGEAGIGKSAFLRRLALEAQLEGYGTVEARCYPASGAPLRAIRALVEPWIPHGRAGRALRARMRRCLEPQHAKDREASPSGDVASWGRRGCVREIVDVLLEATGSRRTLLLVDDVHLADPLALEVLSSLAREIAATAPADSCAGAAPPCLAVSFRSESPFRAPLRPLLDALESPSGRHHVEELAPLDEEMVERWLDLLLAAPPEREEPVVVSPSARSGNPFAVREAVRARRGGPGARVVLDKDPCEIHRAYLSALAGEARGLLKTLAVLGRPATGELLADLVALPASRLSACIEALRQDGALGEERGLWFFQHGSLHGGVLDALSAQEKSAIHTRIAEVLEAKRARSIEEVAQHWLDSDTPERGVDAALAAARACWSGHAASRAAHFYTRALDLLPAGAGPSRRAVAIEAAEAYAGAGEFPRAIELLEGVLRAAEGGGEDEEARGRVHQSLAAIHANLAVLEAKTASLDGALQSVQRAARSVARCESRRTRFLCLHSAGIVNHLAGRDAAAIESFKAAIELGEAIGDEFAVAFDLVYLGECHLFRGEKRAARAALDRTRAMGPACPRPVLGMVRARSALLDALGGNAVEVRNATGAGDEGTTEELGYLDAWNRVFSGWALRLSGHIDAARREFEPARAFFARVHVDAGEIHAALELAACDLDEGAHARAAKRLDALASRFTCGRGALQNPMLSARLLAYRTRLALEQPRPRPQEAASLLVEAESCLIGLRIQDLETLARQLRRRLHTQSLDGEHLPAACTETPRGPEHGVALAGCLRDAAADLVLRFEEDLGRERAAGLRSYLEDFERHVRDLAQDAERAASPPGRAVRIDAIIGASPGMRKLVAMVRRLAGSRAPVLIRGETGTGKELVARALHGEGPRSGARFLSVSCAALPAELLEAELFGHARGAFTGAEDERPGLLLSADGGSFFFDEVAEMAPELQAKLLRVLDRSAVRPVGATDETRIDVRFIFSTQRDMTTLVEEGRLRPDLFYRLSTFEIVVPPLRERIEDLPELVERFRSLAGAEGDAPAFDREALGVLAAHHWPGNVRELENVVSRLTLMCAARVRAEDVRRALGAASSRTTFPAELLRSRPFGDLLAQLERDYLLQLHDDCGGDLRAMARALGIQVRALYDRFRRLGLAPRHLRRER